MNKSKLPISLFDIIGPVMIGPSSSHTAGAARIGYEAYKTLGGLPEKISIKLFNSFSDTGRGHKTDLAVLGGCLGISPEDEKIILSEQIANKKGVNYKIKWGYHSSDFHPNTTIIKLQKGNLKVGLVGYSIGGGRIKIVQVSKEEIDKASDFGKDEVEDMAQKYEESNEANETYYTFNELKEENKTRTQLLKTVLELEEKRGERSKGQILNEFHRRWEIMVESVYKGTARRRRSQDGMFGGDSYRILRSKYNVLSKVVEDGVTYAIGVGELNASMGKIVASPTAGSCGIIPGTLFALKSKYRFSKRKMVESLIVAGAIGAVVANKVELAGAVAGCQAEIGVAGSMAAGAGAFLLGGNLKEIEAASSLVLANLLGLTCDPVMGRVEVPCIIRMGMVTSMAFTGMELALDGIEYTIPFDEVIDVMKKVGHDMSEEYKETSQGGLAKTKTAMRICRACRSCG